MEKETSAISAHRKSIASATAGDKAGWLALFRDDAMVRDPVGRSPHDPDGVGFRGSARIEEFWDIMIGPGDLNIVPHKRYPCGDDVVAVSMTACNIRDGVKTYVEMIGVYEVDEAGLIRTLSVYWDAEALMERYERALRQRK